MNPYIRLFEHNDWADQLVLAAAQDAPNGFFDGEGRPGAGTLLDRLRHLLGVERAFLDALEGQPAVPEPPTSLDALKAYAGATMSRYRTYLAGLDDASADVFIPWWGRTFPVSDCLAQVIAHSAQHRAEVAWELARTGIDTGELDYIRWANEQGM